MNLKNKKQINLLFDFNLCALKAKFTLTVINFFFYLKKKIDE